MVKKEVIKTIRRWEIKNLTWGLGYYDKWKGSHKSLSDNMRTRGYDAYRISPRSITKFGLKYRTVFGASIEPAHKWKKVKGKNVSYTLKDSKGKIIPKVTWFKQGYIKAGKRKGTFLTGSQNTSYYSQSRLKSLLMKR